MRVAFIGMTLEGTPTIVTPSGVVGLTFQDEADTVNAIVVGIVNRLHDDVDLVLSGHTHAGYNCEIDGKRVTSARSSGDSSRRSSSRSIARRKTSSASRPPTAS